MGAIQFGGLASGLDTSSLIDGLMQVDALRLEPIAEQSKQIDTQLTAVGRLQSYLDTFSKSIKDLSSASSLYLSSVSSNKEDIVKAKASGSADLGQGSISIEVKSLAVNEKTQSKTYESSDEALGLEGSFSINGENVSIEATDDLKDIRDKINSTDGIGAVASILKVSEGDYRLTITNDDGGIEGATFEDGDGVLNDLGIIGEKTPLGATSVGYTKKSSEIGTEGKFEINGVEVTIDATDTLKSVKDKLNAIDGVSASITQENGEYKLKLSGATDYKDKDGVLKDMGFASTSSSTSKNILQAGVNAKIVIDGSIEIERNTNKIDDVIDGLELDLQSAEEGTQVNIDFARDYSSVKDKVQEFVNSYNVVVNYIGDQTKYDEETKTTGDLGNSNLARRVISDLRSIINVDHSDYLPAEYSTLGNIGITTDQRTGVLNVDSDKLMEAMEGNFDAFVKMFSDTQTTSVTGLNIGASTNDTKNGKYYADPVENKFYDITEAKEAVDALPSNLGADNVGDKYFLTTEKNMYTWNGSSWGNKTNITSAEVEFSNGINTVKDGNGKGLGFDGTTAGLITFTKGYAGLFESLIENSMLDSENGYFKSEKDKLNNTKNGYEDQYDRMEARLEATREMLVKQFAQVEQMISQMQSSSSGLSSLVNVQ